MIPAEYKAPIVATLRDWRLEMQSAGVSEAFSRGILARVLVRAIPRFRPGMTDGLSIALAGVLLDELYADPDTSVPVVAPTSEAAQVLWPAYRCDDYCRHGDPGEDANREAAHAGAMAAGLDCIRFRLDHVPGAELSMHLFHYRSPVDGHYLNDSENWRARALVYGVTRWQIEYTGTDYAGIRDRFKDYPAGTVQWVGALTAEARADLRCDVQGVNR